MGLIEGWSNTYCSKFNLDKKNCPIKPYCAWTAHGHCSAGTEDPKFNMQSKNWRQYLLDRRDEESDEEEEVEVEAGNEEDLERARAAARRAQGEFQDRGRAAEVARAAEDAELAELERNMNTPPRKPAYPSRPSGQIPSIQMPRRQIAQRQIAQPPIAQPVFPPYQTNIFNNNVFMKNKYLSVRSDQYDFDPNSNVPMASGSVKSIRSTRPSSRSRVQRSPDKKLDKPARPEKTQSNKKIKPPPTFAKILNQLLPILLIALILIYIIYFYRKRSR